MYEIFKKLFGRFSNMDSLMDFDEIEFAENADPRCAISFVLDCSDSMTHVFPGESRSALEALNGGLDTLVAEIHRDPLSRRRIEASFLPYGTDVAEPTPYATVENLVLPELTPMGITNTGAALKKALDSLDERKNNYKQHGISYYQSQMFLMSDGLSMDSLDEVSAIIQKLEKEKKLAFFAIGVAGADLDQLSKIGIRPALGLQGLKFDELFQWISQSAASVSASQVGDKIALPNPAGWAEI